MLHFPVRVLGVKKSNYWHGIPKHVQPAIQNSSSTRTTKPWSLQQLSWQSHLPDQQLENPKESSVSLHWCKQKHPKTQMHRNGSPHSRDSSHWSTSSSTSPLSVPTDTQPIDLCTGSREFCDALRGAWYLPFGEPLGLQGDHLTLGLDFNIDKLFMQQATPSMQTITHGVNSNNPTLVKEFCKHAIQASLEADLYGRIHHLLTKEQFSPSNHEDLEQIDAELMQILVNADKKCKKPGNHPQSPELHKAYIIHYYWTFQLSSKCTGRQYPQALPKWKPN